MTISKPMSICEHQTETILDTKVVTEIDELKTKLTTKVAVNQPEIHTTITEHATTIFDLAFVLDCTKSMSPYFVPGNKATEFIGQIFEEIVALEKSDVKLALVEYRDHPPQEGTFTTRVHNFTDSVQEMKKWLGVGGGDIPEAVAEALDAALKLDWREGSTKICILITDAPPHGLSETGVYSFPNDCSCDINLLDVVKKMVKKEIKLYSVGCGLEISDKIIVKNFFSEISTTTGGKYVPLEDPKSLSKAIGKLKSF